MDIKEKYKEIRKEYLVRWFARGKLKADCRVDVGVTPAILVKLMNELKCYNRKKLVNELPNRLKSYNFIRKVKFAEISWDSGISGYTLVGRYLQNAKIVYIASPFIKINDLKYIAEKIGNKVEDFRIITNYCKDNKDLKKEAEKYNCKVKYLDIHAKIMITDKVCILGSMNFNEYGFQRCYSIEIVMIIEDKDFIKDRIDQFLWWWDLASDIEKILGL